MEIMCKEAVVAEYKVNPGIWLEGLRKTIIAGVLAEIRTIRLKNTSQKLPLGQTL
jgi:hypothetical protein